VIVRGKTARRGEAKKAECILCPKLVPIAVIEAKDNNHKVGAGMQQALGCAESLDAPLACFAWIRGSCAAGAVGRRCSSNSR
jgi:type I restriction enzyme, R subunit